MPCQPKSHHSVFTFSGFHLDTKFQVISCDGVKNKRNIPLCEYTTTCDVMVIALEYFICQEREEVEENCH